MSATSAPDLEPALNRVTTETSNVESDAQEHVDISSTLASPTRLDPEASVDTLLAAVSPVKQEESDGNNAANETVAGRHDISRIGKGQESEADSSSPGIADLGTKKRKRRSSPPWQFPTVEAATMKSADGRRVSARVNITPALSESEGHSRPRSESRLVSKSRPASPPWKGFAAEGPTSINVDGKRKSGRVNKDLSELPKRISPRTKKQVDKLVDEPKVDKRRRKSVAISTPPQQKRHKVEDMSDSPLSSASPARTIADLQAQIAALKPSRAFSSPVKEKKKVRRPPKRKRSSDGCADSLLDASVVRKGASLESPEITRPPTKIRLRLNVSRHTVPPPHPGAIPPSPTRPPKPSLFQILEDYELQELQQPFMENDRGLPDAPFFLQRNEQAALAEATWRTRILKAAESGGPLSKEQFTLYSAERQSEPPEQFGHWDHVVAQALWLRQLQIREKTAHRAQAKKIAYEALEYWKAMRGPTEEDIQAEQDKITKLVYKQVVADVQAKWALVDAHVQQLRKERWEAEETLRRQARLQKQLERSEKMIARQRGDYDSDVNTDDEVDSESMGDEGDVDELDDSSDENMSESDSDHTGSAEEEEQGEMGSDELAQYLQQRDAQLQQRTVADDDDDGTLHTAHADTSEPEDDELPTSAFLADVDDDEAGKDASEPQAEAVPGEEGAHQEEALEETTTAEGQPEEILQHSTRSRRSASVASNQRGQDTDLNLSSDESVDMYDSDEDMSSSSDDDADDEEVVEADSDAGTDEVEQSMLGFLFTSKQIKEVTGLPTPTTSTEGDKRDRTAEVTSDDNADHGLESGVSERMLNVAATDIAGIVDEDIQINAVKGADVPINGMPADQADAEDVMDVTLEPADLNAKTLVPIPTLLTAELRSYQHAGLDWLASLYRSDTNGILADEMGLGKTIQTISLLAHIAEQYDVWETHLIIVPTSVVLNWVTEFHRFLPGFRVLGYYGNIEERAAKRKHWANDPHHQDPTKRGYNVVITSYSVAQQDMNALKVVKWHYMVLDEAHNIRNFQSQRWQSLIKLNTKARLLLTGTPLQNSLTELWSLLTFLTAGDDDPAHGNLEEFLSHWKEPVKEIFESGVTALSTEAQKVVDQLHISLRPFLLRRLKSEVEKDLPKKIESVIVCKLSKRQRQLYQEYMGLASTRESLQRGNAVTAGSVLLSLRKVCNHPDLFDPRPIQTSFAMQDSAVQTSVASVKLIRSMLEVKKDVPVCLQIASHERWRKRSVKRTRQLAATRLMKAELAKLEQVSREAPDIATMAGGLALQRLHQREKKLQLLRESIRVTEESTRDLPVYGQDLREILTIHRDTAYSHTPRGQTLVNSLRVWPALSRRPLQLEHPVDALLARSTSLQRDITSFEQMAQGMKDTIVHFAFCTPVATAPVLDYAMNTRLQESIRANAYYPQGEDFAHEARTRTTIAFPDSRLLIYDAGKLQRLTKLLRDLQLRGSRSLIFTQMTGTLDVLERFLNLLNLPYLRLDGSTPIEKRQLYAAEFNRPDSRYQCMILSSRAGGVGLNLTGASSVIFYDLDWNPQMDRQCMDRAHRIGQMRDVEVYKMVSEKTVEENILRRANQKSLLDQTVIQEGHFTTEYQASAHHAVTHLHEEEVVDDAIERYLGGSDKARMKAMESVEDREDFQAAQRAGKEEHQDELEFAENKSSHGRSAAPTPGPMVEEETADGIDRKGHVDSFMIKEVEGWYVGISYAPAPVRRLDKHGRDPSHRPKKRG